MHDIGGATNRGKWMALIAALLGWMFDGFEIGMFPLVGHNALNELLPDASAVVKGDSHHHRRVQEP